MYIDIFDLERLMSFCISKEANQRWLGGITFLFRAILLRNFNFDIIIVMYKKSLCQEKLIGAMRTAIVMRIQ